jgi:monofunctional biosynthetic peptidoglycan transglycosylase
MADAKPRNGRRLALGTVAAALVWLFGVWPPPVWWRDHWPRETAMMREAPAPAGSVPSFRPTRLAEISPPLQRMVIIGEDSRFRTHHGIDPAEIAAALGLEADGGRGFWRTLAAAWRHRDRLRGASTITQQLAKNLYLSPSRNPLRKLKEAVTALRLELALSKDRILELYLNVAEWGPGVWGADAASRARGDAAASPHVHTDLPPRPHPGAARPDPRPLSRRGGVHPARGRGYGAGRT